MDIARSLSTVNAQLRHAARAGHYPTLVAVSKYKPNHDIQAAYDAGHRHFGENYVNELEAKAKALPTDISWHFIGTFQSNKAKTLAAIPNLYAVHTITSVKGANALDKALADRPSPLRVLLQVNTSNEDSKSGLPPSSQDLKDVASHIVSQCPHLRLYGLMTIGSFERSAAANETDQNPDFDSLIASRDYLEAQLKETASDGSSKWGDEQTGRLALSMGMSSDYEAAVRAGSDIVRVGTAIFGARNTTTTTT